MNDVMRQPIPLQQINAFEAAARQLSFSHAAKELNVLQPAISRHIAALEENLNTKLFLRTKPRLTLTADGATLSEAVSQGFEAIRHGIDTLRKRKDGETIIVTTSIGFTSLYLLPRLAEFQTLHPETKLQIVTQDQNPDLELRNSDILITFGDQGAPGTLSRKVFSENMIAVCHPNLLPDGRQFSRRDLTKQKLLHLSDRDHNNDWKRFFGDTGIDMTPPAPHHSFVSYMVYLRAIQNGLGIGIGWRHLLQESLENGSLVQACSHEHETQRGYFCSIATTCEKKLGTHHFIDWIAKT